MHAKIHSIDAKERFRTGFGFFSRMWMGFDVVPRSSHVAWDKFWHSPRTYHEESHQDYFFLIIDKVKNNSMFSRELVFIYNAIEKIEVHPPCMHVAKLFSKPDNHGPLYLRTV